MKNNKFLFWTIFNTVLLGMYVYYMFNGLYGSPLFNIIGVILFASITLNMVFLYKEKLK
jgi:hypothetical protein